MRALYVHGGVAGADRGPLPSLSSAFPGALECTSSLDAVEHAIRALEDDERLNAGYGSVLNRDGELELDAGIADGSTGSAGAVAGVRVRNPITLARAVLERTPHVLMVGAGAERLADNPTRAETSPRQMERWRAAHVAGEFTPRSFGRDDHVETVGAVALDAEARLSAGSSTGGVFGQLPGRVGDAPIFGAGLYASAHVAAVGTGVGELFMRSLACREAGRLIEQGVAPQEACELTIAALGKIDPIPAGILAVDAEGRVGAAFRGAAWAVEGPDGPVRPAHLP